MFETLDAALPYITALLFGLAVLLVALAVRFFRRSRSDTYWRQRRDAGQRGLRVLILAFILFLASGALCLVTLLVTMIDDANEATAMPDIAAQLTENATTFFPTNTTRAQATVESTGTDETTAAPISSTPEPTATPAATNTPPTPVVLVVTATPVYTPTQTPFPTFTPRANTSRTETAVEQNVTPQPDADLTITAIDDRISDTLEPVNPRTTFTDGTRRIYFFVAYDDMADGTQWTRQLHKDGVLIDDTTYDWRQGRRGNTYFFFGSNDGFTPGNYEIRLFIGGSDEPTDTSNFMILPAP